MSYVASHVFQYEDLEVEIVLAKLLKTRKEAELLAANPAIREVLLYPDKMVIGRGDNQWVIKKENKELYQFKLCENSNEIVRLDSDYKKITWNEAIHYILSTSQSNSMQMRMHSTAYYTCRAEVFDFS
ncbi:hypothetical protein CN918_28385 [Priestia megaterium]|nr:hypothetical protein CN918_28385 [Priestia megaterium]